MLSKEEVRHIAKLARLGLSDKEITKYQKELSSILDYIEKLKEVDVSNIEPTSHPFDLKNVKREDVSKESEADSDTLIGLVPETKDKHVKVKSIL